jgi:photosystem II stability/assembly factor-like uncharacterized protein
MTVSCGKLIIPYFSKNKNRMRVFFLLTVLCFSTLLFAQPSTEVEMTAANDHRKKMSNTSLLKNYPARNIGPTIQGGRIVDMDVNLKTPKEFYVGYASGGIFKTKNNGITFEPIFDNNDALGVGDFVLSQQNTNTLYVGTGEKNSSRSSYAGSGIYKTTDGGKSWSHLGLANTQHISRIVLDPQNDNVVYVAALGSLYSNNTDRGIYKSTDGGTNWRKTLFINDSVGIIDLVINPKDSKQLWASSWDRSRKASNFKGNGEGSAIYRSNDGGETWNKAVAGFPQGKQVGRIGLDVCLTKPNVVYAILDNQGEVPDKKKEEKTEAAKLRIEDFKTMTKEVLLQTDDKKLDEFLKENNFPKKYTAAIVKKDIKNDKYSTKAIADYFGADANLFNTKVIGAEVYRSDDGGSTWKKMNSYDLDGVFYTYGYYFAEMKVTPSNPDVIYIYGVPMLKSIDSGINWHRLDTLQGERDIHVDHHAVWVNPNDAQHVLLGNDGGLYQSYDEGANWIHINNMSVGQFYTVNADMETPYNVYGGLQDNGVLKGSSKSVPNETPHWEPIFGGDGMYVAPDPRNSKLVYTGFQFGNYFKLDNGKTSRITPSHDIGAAPFRWNWRTPVMLSKHNADIVYMVSQHVHRSFNKGETFEVISPDLTKNLKQGNVPFSTLSSFAESPLKFGLLYAGSDDGNVWVSKNSGASWESITSGLPENKWVSSISASAHDEGTVFISLNGYRNDDFKTYLYVSYDYGKTWTSVKGNLPEAVANVIIQDPVNADLLYCGLDNGTYVSFNKGTTWQFFNAMLNVASYDMMVHPRENELIVGTHGRSIFVADVKPLQQLKDGGSTKGVLAFTPESIRHSTRWGEKQFEWDKPNLPKATVLYYTGREASTTRVEIYDEKNALVRQLTTTGALGFNTLTWDLKINQASPVVKGKVKSKTTTATEPAVSKYASKGKYKIKFTNGADVSEITLEIK